MADGGTIFLDEVGDAAGELQAKLLRVIESSTFKRLGGVEDITVDVRVIAATNRDLEAMVEEGAFRRDLYYRLNVIPVELPPLRERPEDIPALARFLLARATRGKALPLKLATDLAERLPAHDWPGNIRELDHAMKHAAAMAEGGRIVLGDLPEPVRAAIEKAGEALPAAPVGAARAEPDVPAASRPAAARSGAADGAVINSEALRRAVKSLGPAVEVESEATFEVPAHVDHAKRAYLEVLIDEFGGDFAKMGKLWDRGSEKTLRKLIRTYGLADALDAARARRPGQ
jgi:DNA-binding NtrC family response regulator